MGQYLDLAKKALERAVPMPDAVRPARPSSSEAQLPHANDGNVPMPGCYVRWQRGDGSQAQGKVIELLVDPSVDPPIVVLVTLHDGSEATLNPRTVKLWVMDESTAQK